MTETTERQTYRFGSKASCLLIPLRGAEPIYAPGTATVIGREKEIVAEFGETSGEYTVFGPDGQPMVDPHTGLQIGKTADARGHYFDSRLQQEQKGWTDEQHDLVVARIQYCCKAFPEQVWELAEVKVDPPWPKYDLTHHNTIPQLAADTGRLAEALTYERQNKNRDTLVQKLETLLAAEQRELEQEEALVAS